jgi:hypothetical protein
MSDPHLSQEVRYASLQNVTMQNSQNIAALQVGGLEWSLVTDVDAGWCVDDNDNDDNNNNNNNNNHSHNNRDLHHHTDTKNLSRLH